MSVAGFRVMNRYQNISFIVAQENARVQASTSR